MLRQRPSKRSFPTAVQAARAAPGARAASATTATTPALPSLGRSVQAAALEETLAGLSVQNVAADALGMLAVLLLWRQILAQNPELL